jgi:hypothetical protein
MEKFLQIEPKMSGYRIEHKGVEIGSLPYIVEYNMIPHEIRKQYWWSIKTMSIDILHQDDEMFTIRSMFDSDVIIKDVRIAKEVMETSYIRMSHDDSITSWVYMNRKDIWAELVEYFGSEERVWTTYLRWRH